MLPFLPADQELVTPGRAGSPEAGPSAGGRETTLRDGVGVTSKITPSCWGNRRENTTKRSAGERRAPGPQPSAGTVTPTRPQASAPGQHSTHLPEQGEHLNRYAVRRYGAKNQTPFAQREQARVPRTSWFLPLSSPASHVEAKRFTTCQEGKCAGLQTAFWTHSVTAGETVLLWKPVRYLRCDQL